MSSWFLGRLEVSQAAREVPAPHGIFSCRILSVTSDRDLTRWLRPRASTGWCLVFRQSRVCVSHAAPWTRLSGPDPHHGAGSSQAPLGHRG